MAEDVADKTGSFLTRKVGPLPMWAWIGGGLALWLYFQRQQASTAKQAAANQQTDPAGNIGSIDPATGYVYGTPEDLAALAANNAGTSSGGGSGTAGQNSTSGGQAYADNNSWGIAAVNFLVGLGVDAVTANQAVQLYLSSQPLTTAQQADVNLAIAKLGPPPTLPGPVTGNPPPVHGPPGGGGGGGKPPPKTVPPPTGLAVQSKSSNHVAVKWNRVTGATGYYADVTDNATKKVVNAHAVNVSQTSVSVGGLKGGQTYTVNVWAEPPSTHSGAHASITVTLPK